MGNEQDETRIVDTEATHSKSSDASSTDASQTIVGTNSPHLSGEFGRYQIEKLLGSGAMGSVYLAHDSQLNRKIALKVPLFAKDSTGNLIARFVREAQSAATLDHPNICPIYDVGEHEQTRFIAMAYVEGRPLSDYINTGKQQSERQVALVVRKLALAMHEAHQRGIIHRDLKPANIMVNKRGEPIVMDFGLARQMDDDTEARLTKEGTMVGTPCYMAPEQLTGSRQLEPATDIYSLGVILYELLAGKRPFSGSVVTVITQVLHSEPIPVEDLRANLSPDLAVICKRAMAKQPADRYESMAQFAADLASFLRAAPSSAAVTAPAMAHPSTTLGEGAMNPIGTQAVSNGVATTPGSPTIRVSGRRVSFSPVALVAGAVLLVFGTVGAVVAILFGLGSDNKVAEPPPNKVVDTPSSDLEATPTQAPIEPPPSGTNADEPSAFPELTGPPPFPGPQGPMSESFGPPNMPEPPGPGKPGREPRTPPRNLPPEEKFSFLDLNQDSKLNSHELMPHIIRKADSNGDDVVTMEEFMKAYKEHGEELFGPPGRPGRGRNGGPRGFRP